MSNKIPSVLREESGSRTTASRFSYEVCRGRKCKFRNEVNLHKSGQCIHCGYGWIPMDPISMRFMPRDGKYKGGDPVG